MYDLIIKGCGLSGASAGRKAGKLGLNTLLLEKEEFPRYKPCGRGLSEHAISYLCLESPPKTSEWEITEAKFFFKESLSKLTKNIDCLFLFSGTNLIIFFLIKQKKRELKSIQRKKFFAAKKCPPMLK
jgi:flavin-dependent dehydrogenase